MLPPLLIKRLSISKLIISITIIYKIQFPTVKIGLLISSYNCKVGSIILPGFCFGRLLRKPSVKSFNYTQMLPPLLIKRLSISKLIISITIIYKIQFPTIKIGLLISSYNCKVGSIILLLGF
jgi:hypothetical protein